MSKINVSGGGSGKFVLVRGEDRLEVDQNLTAYEAAHQIASWINGPEPEPVAEAEAVTEPEPKKGRAK